MAANNAQQVTQNDAKKSAHLRKTVGESVRVVRTLLGMTHGELATRADLSDVYLRQIENGERNLGLGVLEALAKGLGCAPRDLLVEGGENAVVEIVGTAYSRAPALVQQAIVFLLTSQKSSAQKEALLTLMASEIAPSSPRRGRARRAREPNVAKVAKVAKEPKVEPESAIRKSPRKA